MQLSVIIVNYNVKYFLEQCLASVCKAIKPLAAEVWVVDNASLDGSISYLQAKFSWVKFIINEKNEGFAKANNKVLQLCSGKYVLFLNPDTIVPEDCFTKCIAFMEKNSRAGALGIRMIDGSGTFLPESKRSFPSLSASFYKLAGLSTLFPTSKIFSQYSLGYLDEDKNHEVDVLSGAFILLKKDVLVQLKGFDEAFFMYGEDIDLSYRIQKLGCKNYYFSESTIIHFKGESTRRESLRYIKVFYQAMSIFAKKHYKGRFTYLFTFFITKAIWLRAGLAVTKSAILQTRQFALSRAYFLTQKENKHQKKSITLIAGNIEEYNEVKFLLSEAGQKLTTCAVTTGNVSGIIDEINQLLQSCKIQQIIFCAGYLSYYQIIELIQKLPKKINKRFHVKKTQSIIGSDSKNTLGKITTIDS